MGECVTPKAVADAVSAGYGDVFALAAWFRVLTISPVLRKAIREASDAGLICKTGEQRGDAWIYAVTR